MPDPSADSDTPEGEVVVTGDVIHPFKVILRLGTKSAIEWDVSSAAEGAEQLRDALQLLHANGKSLRPESFWAASLPARAIV